MVAVTVAAALLGAVVTLRRAAHFMRLAVLHEHMSQRIRSQTKLTLDDMRSADDNEMLARKYQRAAARPWLTVEPDPPRPE
jgi:hypothetical protein